MYGEGFASGQSKWSFIELMCDVGLTRFVDTMAVTFSYEPLAHSTRQNDIQFFTTGGRIGIISELKNLFEDCQMVNPSSMAGVPRVWNKLYSEFNEALSAAIEGQPKEVR